MIQRQARRSVFTLVVILFFLGPQPARPQLEAIGGLALGAVFDDLENTLGSLIEDAGARADMTLMKGAYTAELAIEQARISYKDSLNTTVESLDNSQRDVVARIYLLVNEMRQAFVDEIEKVADIEVRLSDTISRIPRVSRAPSVLEWGPLYRVRQANQPYLVTIEGRHLAAGSPFAVVNGRRLIPKVKATNQLVFEIPQELFPAKDFDSITLDLNLFESTRRWLFFSELVESNFRITVYAVPPTLGRLSAYGRQRSESVTIKDRSTRGGIGCHAAHCKSCGSSERVLMQADNERLVTNSVRVHTGYSNNGRFWVSDVSPSGFTMNWSAKSYGCTHLWRGTRGQIRARVAFRVEQRTPTVKEIPLIEEEPLQWGQDLRITPEETLDSVTVVLSNMLGEKEVMTPGEQGRFLQVRYDRGINELIVRPRPIEQALRER